MKRSFPNVHACTNCMDVKDQSEIFQRSKLDNTLTQLSNEGIKCFVSDPKLYIGMDASAGHISNPFRIAKISLQILPAVYHTIPMLLV